MPSEESTKARECVRLAYDHLVLAGHYAPLSPIRTAQTLVLQTLIALYDVEVSERQFDLDSEDAVDAPF